MMTENLAIDIFRTDIRGVAQKEDLLKKLQHEFPACRFNIDLNDDDRVLRVIYSRSTPVLAAIERLARDSGVTIEQLE